MVILVGAALVGAAGIWMLFTRFRPAAIRARAADTTAVPV
jgi:hypothetical protein